ncbi:Uncharacterized protein dnm_054650 [Desulfonema magnum]|uniref:Uncharacterized protein n=1 Tax=Desulfonema magnum TaxID=45655 RepID=A0A975GQ17_9BACT|nr:Uncharacterized protein dnm_054650 [Desulfonema magnum]
MKLGTRNKHQVSSFKFQVSNIGGTHDVSCVDRSFLSFFYMAFYTESLHG